MTFYRSVGLASSRRCLAYSCFYNSFQNLCNTPNVKYRGKLLKLLGKSKSLEIPDIFNLTEMQKYSRGKLKRLI